MINTPKEYFKGKLYKVTKTTKGKIEKPLPHPKGAAAKQRAKEMGWIKSKDKTQRKRYVCKNCLKLESAIKALANEANNLESQRDHNAELVVEHLTKFERIRSLINQLHFIVNSVPKIKIKSCNKWRWDGMPGNNCICGSSKDDHIPRQSAAKIAKAKQFHRTKI